MEYGDYKHPADGRRWGTDDSSVSLDHLALLMSGRSCYVELNLLNGKRPDPLLDLHRQCHGEMCKIRKLTGVVRRPQKSSVAQ